MNPTVFPTSFTPVLYIHTTVLYFSLLATGVKTIQVMTKALVRVGEVVAEVAEVTGVAGGDGRMKDTVGPKVGTHISYIIGKSYWILN